MELFENQPNMEGINGNAKQLNQKWKYKIWCEVYPEVKILRKKKKKKSSGS